MFLEQAAGDLADKHEKLSMIMDAAHSSMKDIHAKGASNKSVCEALPASIHERLDHIETCIKDDAGKHNSHMIAINGLKDMLRTEQCARIDHTAHVKGELDRHETAYLAHYETLNRSITNERSTREAAHRSLQDVVHKERTAREEHHSTHQQLIEREQEAHEHHLSSIDDRLTREKGERLNHLTQIGVRLDALENTAGVFDQMAYKEQSERKAEFARVWDAIERHTHDRAPLTCTETPQMTCASAVPCARVVAPVAAPIVASIEAPSAPMHFFGACMVNTPIPAAAGVFTPRAIPVVKTVLAYEVHQGSEVVCDAQVKEFVRVYEPEPEHQSHATETITC